VDMGKKSKKQEIVLAQEEAELLGLAKVWQKKTHPEKLFQAHCKQPSSFFKDT